MVVSSLVVVFSSSGRVGEGIVCVIDKLEASSPLLAVGRVVGDPIGVRLQGSPRRETVSWSPPRSKGIGIDG